MQTIPKLGLAVASVAAIGSATLLSTGDAAQAASLSGTLSFTGTVSGLNSGINPGSDTFNLSLPTAINAATGDFTGFGAADITNLVSAFTITKLANIDTNNSDGITSASYTFAAIPSFIQFSNGYSFSLDAGSLIRLRQQITPVNLISLFAGGVLTGSFTDGTDTTVAVGSLGITSVPIDEDESSSSYTLSLTSTPIPTPALLPGLIGMGIAALRRKPNAEASEENA